MILNFGLARFSICGKAPKESDRRQKCAETARAENSAGGKMGKHIANANDFEFVFGAFFSDFWKNARLKEK